MNVAIMLEATEMEWKVYLNAFREALGVQGLPPQEAVGPWLLTVISSEEFVPWAAKQVEAGKFKMSADIDTVDGLCKRLAWAHFSHPSEGVRAQCKAAFVWLIGCLKKTGEDNLEDVKKALAEGVAADIARRQRDREARGKPLQ